MSEYNSSGGPGGLGGPNPTPLELQLPGDDPFAPPKSIVASILVRVCTAFGLVGASFFVPGLSGLLDEHPLPGVPILFFVAFLILTIAAPSAYKRARKALGIEELPRGPLVKVGGVLVRSRVLNEVYAAVAFSGRGKERRLHTAVAFSVPIPEAFTLCPAEDGEQADLRVKLRMGEAGFVHRDGSRDTLALLRAREVDKALVRLLEEVAGRGELLMVQKGIRVDWDPRVVPGREVFPLMAVLSDAIRESANTFFGPGSGADAQILRG